MGEGIDPKFQCAACGREFKWKPELAGKKAKCKCGAVVSVPREAPVAESAPLEDDPFDVADTPEPISPRRSGTTVAPPPPMPAPQQLACPICNMPAPPTAVLCTACGYNFRTGMRMPGAGRVPVRAAPSGGIAADTYEQAAKFSWMAPIAAILLGCCTVGARNSGPGIGLAIAGLQLLLIVGGLAAGIFGVVGSKKFGPERLLMPSITGIVLNGLIIGLNIYLFSMLLSGRAPFGKTARGTAGGGGTGSAAVAPRTPQQMQQDGEDAFLKEDGWMGVLQHRGAVVTLVTIPDRTPAAANILSNLGAPVSVLILAVDNTRGGDSLEIDPTGATLHLTDGMSQPMPDVVQVLQTAKTERAEAVRAFSPPFSVMPGRQLVGKFLFLPPNTDPSTIAQISLKIDGRPATVSGKFMTAAQKQAAAGSGGR